jgi:hypothetical protein
MAMGVQISVSGVRDKVAGWTHAEAPMRKRKSFTRRPEKKGESRRKRMRAGLEIGGAANLILMLRLRGEV